VEEGGRNSAKEQCRFFDQVKVRVYLGQASGVDVGVSVFTPTKQK